jgi:hypothetical protein
VSESLGVAMHPLPSEFETEFGIAALASGFAD